MTVRRDRVPRVLRRARLGHGAPGGIADHYTHIGEEMIQDLLTRQTKRWQAALAARARIDQATARSRGFHETFLRLSRSIP